MYKFIGNLLLLALFVGASAFTTAASAPSTNQVEMKAGKKALTSLTLTQTGSRTLTASWTATGGGPFVVTLYDATNTPLQQIFTNGLSQAFNKLTIGQSYRVSVQDVNGTVLLSNLVPVLF